MTKQEAAIKYITENYLDFNRLRHDIVSDKLQIRMEADLEGSEWFNVVQNGSELSSAEKTTLHYSTQPLHHSTPCFWREMTKHDINSIVCHCAQEYDANITSREVMTALQSDLIPDVHPLREYVLSCGGWTAEQPDWIDWVAQQVRVKMNNNEDTLIQQPKQHITNNIPLTNTASGEGYDLNDNNDNLRPNQYPLGAQGEDKNQQPKQLDPTTCSVRNNTASGEGYDLNDNNDNLRGNRTAKQIVRTNVRKDLPAAPMENNTTPSYTTLHHTTPSADALWRQCFKKWFVAMVASWMKDEVVNHQVLVLIGKQGIFKTTWLEHLIPPHLRAYACKLANSNDLNKDERLRIAEFGLISLDEIDSMNNRELNQLKSVITATDVNERAAYAYTKERRVRLASFCASGNRRDFLTDITGNRRWLPFEVESIQNPFFTLLPYERMYAQAWALAQDPLFSYWFDLDEIEVLEEHNQHFRDESNEEQLLDVYFAVPAEGATNTKFLTTAEISERLIYYGNIKRPLSLSRLGVLLSQKGFLSIRKGSPQRRGWIVYERDSEEINAERRILSKT